MPSPHMRICICSGKNIAPSNLLDGMDEAERAVQMFKMKKLIKKLTAARGCVSTARARHTRPLPDFGRCVISFRMQQRDEYDFARDPA